MAESKHPRDRRALCLQLAQVLEKRTRIRKRFTTNDNTPVQVGLLTGQVLQDRFGHTARHRPATHRGAGPLCLNLTSGP